jgi:hypothetical protein
LLSKGQFGLGDVVRHVLEAVHQDQGPLRRVLRVLPPPPTRPRARRGVRVLRGQ